MAEENRLIDTNVLVYAYDVSEKAKRQIAHDLWTGFGMRVAE